jgi:hypothetical protein
LNVLFQRSNCSKIRRRVKIFSTLETVAAQPRARALLKDNRNGSTGSTTLIATSSAAFTRPEERRELHQSPAEHEEENEIERHAGEEGPEAKIVFDETQLFFDGDAGTIEEEGSGPPAVKFELGTVDVVAADLPEGAIDPVIRALPLEPGGGERANRSENQGKDGLEDSLHPSISERISGSFATPATRLVQPRERIFAPPLADIDHLTALFERRGR